MLFGQDRARHFKRFRTEADGCKWLVESREDAGSSSSNPADDGSRNGRNSHFPQLANGDVFLDNAGAPPVPKWLIDAHASDLATTLVANPHSEASGPAAAQTAARIAHVRTRILRFFGVDPSTHTVVFTSNATAALRLVADAFPWTAASHFCFHESSHTSVVGIRQAVSSAAAAGRDDKGSPASWHCMSTSQIASFIKGSCQRHRRDGANCNACRPTPPSAIGQEPSRSIRDAPETHSLLAFPAQSNFSGERYPLEWIRAVQGIHHVPQQALIDAGIQQSGHAGWTGRWSLLLDCASFVASSRLDLSAWPADFAVVSFYKIFGFPTGLGALIVHNDTALTRLIPGRSYFGGGTVAAVAVDAPFCRARQDVAASHEQGTLPFTEILALEHGFDYIETHLGGWGVLSLHVDSLASWTRMSMAALRHENGLGLPVCTLYPSSPAADQQAGSKSSNNNDNDDDDNNNNNNITGDRKDDPLLLGPIIAFNLLDDSGHHIGYSQVARLAGIHKIHLRSGCFCNPGACQSFLCLSAHDIQHNFEHHGHSCGDGIDLIQGLPTGALRVSFGPANTWADAQKWMAFLKSHFVSGSVMASSPAPRPSLTSTQARLSGIALYPIKSCGAFVVQSWPVAPSGLLWDRYWMLVDALSGNPVTQKQCPRMCRVRIVALDRDNSTLTVRFSRSACNSNSNSILDAFDRQLTITAEPSSQSQSQADEWFSHHLQQRVRLVAGSAHAMPKGMCSRSNVAAAGMASFANQSPYLIVSRSSFESVVTSMSDPVLASAMDIMAFRPNFIIDGTEPFAEDAWIGRRLHIGKHELEIGEHCQRCQMVCIDPESGQRSVEPLSTLARTRKVKGRIVFGVHARNHRLLSSCTPITVSVGDLVYSV
ncbi:pyridoxal phosphate-dependent transferase [Entophlyctis helioformis]|nr:pyridoxal phosphate-dependent transferase [Entophlyctis helioformis]